MALGKCLGSVSQAFPLHLGPGWDKCSDCCSLHSPCASHLTQTCPFPSVWPPSIIWCSSWALLCVGSGSEFVSLLSLGYKEVVLGALVSKFGRWSRVAKLYALNIWFQHLWAKEAYVVVSSAKKLSLTTWGQAQVCPYPLLCPSAPLVRNWRTALIWRAKCLIVCQWAPVNRALLRSLTCKHR